MGTNALRAANQEPQEFLLDNTLYLGDLADDLILDPLPLDDEPTKDWWEDDSEEVVALEQLKTTAPQWSINLVTAAMNVVAKLVSPFCTVIIMPKVKQ